MTTRPIRANFWTHRKRENFVAIHDEDDDQKCDYVESLSNPLSYRKPFLQSPGSHRGAHKMMPPPNPSIKAAVCTPMMISSLNEFLHKKTS